MATKANPSARAHLHGRQFRDAAEKDQGHERRAPGIGAHRGGRTPPRRVGTQEAVTDEAEAEPHRCRQGAPNSCSGASPRKRYIGLASELPPVSSSASSAPSASKRRGANRRRSSSSHRPPSHASAMVELGRPPPRPGRRRRAPCAGRCGRSGRGSRRTANWSSRAVELWAQERAQEVVVPDVDLNAVETGFHRQRSRARGSPRDALNAGQVDGAQREPMGVKPPEGEREGAPLERALATGPAWADLAAAAAPRRARRRSGGAAPAACPPLSRRQWRSVAPSWTAR